MYELYLIDKTVQKIMIIVMIAIVVIMIAFVDRLDVTRMMMHNDHDSKYVAS